MSRGEIVERFDLERVSKAPAIFDRAKLDWMNRSYMAARTPERLALEAEPYFVGAGLIPAQPDARIRAWLAQAVDAVRTHVDHLDQLPAESAIIFGFDPDGPRLDEEARTILGTPTALAVAREFSRAVEQQGRLTLDLYRAAAAQVKAATGQKGRNLFHPIRAALTGRPSGPELDRLIPLYEEGSQLDLPRKVMSCRERLRAVLSSL